MTFPIYISNQKFKSSMDLLLVTDENKSHYVYIKDFGRFLFQKKKIYIYIYIYFYKGSLECFNSKNVLAKHKEV